MRTNKFVLFLLCVMFGCGSGNLTNSDNASEAEYSASASKKAMNEKPLPAWVVFRVVDESGKPINGVEVRFGNTVSGKPFRWSVGATTIFEGIASLELYTWEVLPYNSGLYEFSVIQTGKGEVYHGHSLPLNSGRTTVLTIQLGSNKWDIIGEYETSSRPIPVLLRKTEKGTIFSFLLNDGDLHQGYEVFADLATTGDFSTEHYSSFIVEYIFYKTRGTFFIPISATGRIRLTLVDPDGIRPIETMFFDL